MVKDNRKLAEFNLSGIPAMPAGLPKVEVSFLINADGILNIKAKELRSGVEQSIEVKPQYGLTDGEVEKMLLESITNAKEDIRTRALVEAVTEAQQLIETTEKFLQKNKILLSTDELEQSDGAIEYLKTVLQSENKDRIQQKTEELNEITRPFAERVMNESIKESLKGKTI